MRTEHQHGLVDLDEAGLVLADHEEDLRGAEVVDREGGELGTIDGLLVDQVERRVRYLRVGSDVLVDWGRTTRVVPASAVAAVEWEGVRINMTADAVARCPAYYPDPAGP